MRDTGSVGRIELRIDAEDRDAAFSFLRFEQSFSEVAGFHRRLSLHRRAVGDTQRGRIGGGGSGVLEIAFAKSRKLLLGRGSKHQGGFGWTDESCQVSRFFL